MFEDKTLNAPDRAATTADYAGIDFEAIDLAHIWELEAILREDRKTASVRVALEILASLKSGLVQLVDRLRAQRGDDSVFTTMERLQVTAWQLEALAEAATRAHTRLMIAAATVAERSATGSA
jgi:hypothetical protein